jgi:hypothetical protein
MKGNKQFNKALELLKQPGPQILTFTLQSGEPLSDIKFQVTDLVMAAITLPNGIIEIKTDWGSYYLPLSLIHLIANSYNPDDSKLNPILHVKLEQVTDNTLDSFQKSLDLEDYLVSGLYRYLISIEINGVETELNNFGSKYVDRTIILDKQTDPNALTALFFDEQTGKSYSVPALVEETDGKTVVIIRTPHNSLYAVVHSHKTFSDTNGHWAQADIELLATKVFVNGANKTNLKPDEAITRAEFTAMLIRALGLKENKEAQSFSDVSLNDCYAGAIGAAVKAGLITGYPDGRFGPADNISREQMAVLISKALKFKQYSVDTSEQLLSKFIDNKLISTWAK